MHAVLLLPYMLLLSIPIIGVCKKPSYDETEASCVLLLFMLRLQCFREMGGRWRRGSLIASLTLCCVLCNTRSRIESPSPRTIG